MGSSSGSYGWFQPVALVRSCSFCFFFRSQVWRTCFTQDFCSGIRLEAISLSAAVAHEGCASGRCQSKWEQWYPDELDSRVLKNDYWLWWDSVAGNSCKLDCSEYCTNQLKSEKFSQSISFPSCNAKCIKKKTKTPYSSHWIHWLWAQTDLIAWFLLTYCRQWLLCWAITKCNQ